MAAIKITLFCLVIFSVFGLTTLVLAQGSAAPSSLVPCTDNCQTADFFKLAGNIVNYFIFALAVPLAVVAITYAGISMALNPDKEGVRTKGKEIIWTAGIGLVLVLAAWLIVNTLVKYLVKPEVQSKINKIAPLGR